MDKIGSAQFLQDVVTRVLEKLAEFDPFGKEVPAGQKPEHVSNPALAPVTEAPTIPGPKKFTPAKTGTPFKDRGLIPKK